MTAPFSVTHFRSEFIHQGQATIMRRVTMTQFALAILFTALAVWLFQVPFWLAPLALVLGYVAGLPYRGEILLRRGLAYLTVWGRTAAGAPRVVNLASQWEAARVEGRRQGVRPMAMLVD